MSPSLQALAHPPSLSLGPAAGWGWGGPSRGAGGHFLRRPGGRGWFCDGRFSLPPPRARRRGVLGRPLPPGESQPVPVADAPVAGPVPVGDASALSPQILPDSEAFQDVQGRRHRGKHKFKVKEMYLTKLLSTKVRGQSGSIFTATLGLQGVSDLISCEAATNPPPGSEAKGKPELCPLLPQACPRAAGTGTGPASASRLRQGRSAFPVPSPTVPTVPQVDSVITPFCLLLQMSNKTPSLNCK